MNFTAEQQGIVTYTEDELLVRGVAGSGKTIALLANALKRKGEKTTILFITFNKALNQKIEHMCAGVSRNNIEIKNFHSWAYKEISRIYGRPTTTLLYDSDKERIIETAIDNVSNNYQNRFLDDSNKNLKFLAEEFNFIKGKNLRCIEDYMEVRRIGRGTSIRLDPNSIDREVVYAIYKEFENLKEHSRKFEFIDYGFNLYEKVNSVTHYDYVYIDEAQDLNQVEIQLLRAIAKDGFYVCADDGQKIYRTNYTWTEVGANFTGGRTKRLRKSFRSTYDIFKFASELQKYDTTLNGDQYVKPEFDESNKGLKPAVIDCKNKILKNAEIVKRVSGYLEEKPSGKVGILCNNKNICKEVKSVLHSANIDSFLQDGSAKIDFDVSVMVTTLHSSKGLEFDYVIIPEFNEDNNIMVDEKDEDYWNNQRKIWYVAFSRARNKLDVLYDGNNNKLLEEIDEKLYRKIKI